MGFCAVLASPPIRPDSLGRRTSMVWCRTFPKTASKTKNKMTVILCLMRSFLPIEPFSVIHFAMVARWVFWVYPRDLSAEAV